MATIYKYSYVQAVSDIWDYLGTFWSDFEDKDVIEKLWTEMMEVAKYLQKDLYIISLSKTLSTCPAVINSSYDYFTLIYSGTDTTADSYSGYYYVNMPDYTIAVSGLAIVNYSGARTYVSGNNFYNYYIPLINNVDYEFSASTDYRLKLLTPIPENSIIYISGSQKINPALYKSYGILIGYDFDTWKDKNYITPINYVGTGAASLQSIDYESDYWLAIHSKYFIWAMTHYQRALPTIDNIREGLGVAAGFPFTWYSGTVIAKDATTVTVDHGSQFDYRYLVYFRSSTDPYWKTDVIINSGITQFHVLTSGLHVYDNFNSSGVSYVQTLLTKAYQQNSKLVIEFDNYTLIDK